MLGACRRAISLPVKVLEITAPIRCIATSCALRAPISATAPAFQAKGKGKGPSGPAAPAFEEKYDLKKQIPVNLAREGPEPEYKPDSEYPPWIFTLLEEKPLLEDYIMKGLEKVPAEKRRMVFKMANKRQIKEGNANRKKDA